MDILLRRGWVGLLVFADSAYWVSLVPNPLEYRANTVYIKMRIFFFLMFPQIPQQTVSLNKGSIDTWSGSFTQMTTAGPVRATMGQFSVTVSPAPLPHALTLSHKSAARPAKVHLNENLFNLQVLHCIALYWIVKSYMQAVSMMDKREQMVRRGRTSQTHVLCVFVVTAPFSVKGDAVHPWAVKILCRDSAACPVRVRNSNAKWDIWKTKFTAWAP